ncbi:MAG: outer membrane beta-barrel protein [Acidobacteriota bacterium]|nr:outer membrane beta-barrel protein [Acidobacteriota bacterium]MDH3784215.1 outer membrane beta-barrel protein [Acidobacteriota bacterium]
MFKRLIIALIATLFVCVANPVLAGARPDENKKIFGHFAGGLMFPEGDAGDVVDDDIYFSGGFLYWPEEWAAGIGVDLAYTDTDISRPVIQAINDELAMMGAGAISGGDVNIWSLSANSVWGPDTNGSVGFYLTGGVGIDFLEGRITDNGLVYYPPICDPWFWWCIPGGVGPGTIVKFKEDATELSYNVGVGVTFDTNSGSQIFIEARYKSAETDPKSTEYIPLVVGFRW